MYCCDVFQVNLPIFIPEPHSLFLIKQYSLFIQLNWRINEIRSFGIFGVRYKCYQICREHDDTLMCIKHSIFSGISIIYLWKRDVIFSIISICICFYTKCSSFIKYPVVPIRKFMIDCTSKTSKPNIDLNKAMKL